MRAEGDLVAATEAYRTAMALAPGDAAIRAAYEETSALAADKLAHSHAPKAPLAEKLGQCRTRCPIAS